MYRIIGVASGWGAQRKECEQGPDVLREFGVPEKLRKANIQISTWKTLYPQKLAKDETLSFQEAYPLIIDVNHHVEQEVHTALSAGEFPVVIGGDHSIAVGTWNGVLTFLQEKERLPLGLIWIDAHMDSHTPETSPSKAWHGMPLAALLGHGDPKMTKRAHPSFSPQHVCLIGVRSFEEGEEALLQRLKVRIFSMDEVRKKGFAAVLEEALAYLASNGVKSLGVSLDLDVIDPEDAPGVGSPEVEGLSKKECLEVLPRLKGVESLVTFEVVEYNPTRNFHQKTAELCVDILKAVLRTEKKESSPRREL